MRRHRRSAWGDITVDAGGYMNGVLYSRHRAARSHTGVIRKARQGAGVAVKAALRAIAFPFVILMELVRNIVTGLNRRNNTPARTRMAMRELKKPTVLRQAEHITVRLKLSGFGATAGGIEAVRGGAKRREILFGAACLVLCVISIAVAPALAAPPPGSDTITFVDNGRSVLAVTSADTVQEFLRDNGLKLSSGDEINVSGDTPIQNGMVVSIERALPVTIQSGGETYDIGIRSGTVADALKAAGITPDENDRVSPALDTEVYAGMTIRHVVVEVAYVSETEIIPYQTVYQKTSSLAKGREKTKTYGVNGKISHKIRINFENDKEISRYEVSSSVVRGVRNEVILVGTRVSGGSRSSSSSAEVATLGGISKSRIKKTLRMSATAYTHTGHRTATGVYPSRGTVAVNPNVIPYGTRLYIEGYGYGIAADTGSFIYSHPNRIDLFMESRDQCMSWGNRTVTVYILK